MPQLQDILKTTRNCHPPGDSEKHIQLEGWWWRLYQAKRMPQL
jgi:hypothetical protein